MQTDLFVLRFTQSTSSLFFGPSCT